MRREDGDGGDLGAMSARPPVHLVTAILARVPKAEPLAGILGLAPVPDLEIQLGPGERSRVSHRSYDTARFDLVSHFHPDIG